MALPKTNKPEADSQHTSVAQKCKGIVGVSKLEGRLFRQAFVHVLGEALSAEDIS